ncbi:MAG: hypothetical protein HY900_09915 [Deltaproteobacteria bacterium]|nr:hypothetical protein [Deltaproteobacteria bacterium]
MWKDRYDTVLWSLLAATAVALVLVLSGGSGAVSGRDGARSERALERELARQARIDLLEKLYDPVQTLLRSGDLQGALFKLDELARLYPNEAHGRILKGEILYRSGALEEAVAAYVEGVRLNGEYVDAKSRLSRRPELQKVLDEGYRVIAGRARAHPENRSLDASLKKLHYLRSRLAGGCE